MNDMKKPTAAEKRLAAAREEYEKCLAQMPKCPRFIRHGTKEGWAKLAKYNSKRKAWEERKAKLRTAMLEAQEAARKR